MYLGVDEHGDQAAIKWLRPHLAGDAVAAERFAREAAVAQRVAPFCTAKVLATGVHEERPFIVSEYVEGPPLQQVVAEEGPRADASLYRLAIGTVTALAAIHQAGIVHRDFSPNNVLLAGEGPRVIDFGIAKALDATSTITSTPVGTPAFMAPEQVLGHPVGPPADMFAWGSTMVFAATGTGPFEAESVPLIVNQVLYDEPDLSRLTGPLRELVAACLSKDPIRRPTAEQVIMRLLEHPTSNPAELEQAAAVVSGFSPPPPASPQPQFPPRQGFPPQPPYPQPQYAQPSYGQSPYAQPGPHQQPPPPQAAPYAQPGPHGQGPQAARPFGPPPQGPQPSSGPQGADLYAQSGPHGQGPQAAHPHGSAPQGPQPSSGPQGADLYAQSGPHGQGPQAAHPYGPPPQGPQPQSGAHQQPQWVSPTASGQSPQYVGPPVQPSRSGGKKSYVVASIAAAVAIVATIAVVAVALVNLPGPPTPTPSPSAKSTSPAPVAIPTANLVTSTLPGTDAVIYENPGDAVRLTTYMVRDAKTRDWIYYARDTLTGSFTKYQDMWESMLSPDGRYLAQRGKNFVDGYDSVKITDKVTGEAFTVKTSRQPLSAYVQGWSRDSGRLLFNVGNPVKGVWQSTGFAIVNVATRQATVASLREGSLHGIRYGFDHADTGVVALSNDTKQQALRFFDENGLRIRRIPNVGPGIADSLFSPSGKQFVTNCPGLGSGNNCVYDTQTGAELKRLESPCSGLATWYDDSHLVCWVRPDPSGEKQQVQVVDFTGTAVRLLAEMPTNGSNMDVIYTFTHRN